MKVLGIDIGTTSISLVVLDRRSRELVRTVMVDNNSFIHTAEPWARLQDVERIEKNVMDAVKAAFSEFDDITAIGLTGQMHGILYVDQEGDCISPLYTWQDERGNQPEFDKKCLVELIRERTGENTYYGYGWVTHLYNRRKNIVPSKVASFCTIADYLGMKLAGCRKPLLHISMAASLGFFDMEHRRFRKEALELMNADLGIMPDITDRIMELGEFEGIPVYTAIGDNQASVFGAAGDRPGTILINMGTGGQISVIADRNIQIAGIETRPFLDGKFLLVGASLCGGRAYAVLESFFRRYMEAAGADGSQYGVMEKILGSSSATETLKIRTTFQGTRENPELKGSITGITEENFTPAALLRGVLQGMAEELHEMYCKIAEQAGASTAELIGSGNGIRKNRFLREAFEMIFDKHMKMSPYKEEAACGAAIVACVMREI